jgi:hypothetical protein
MPYLRSVLSIITTLVGPLALAILGAVVALALTYRGESTPDRSATGARSGRAFLSNDGETIHVAVDVAKADASTTLVIQGPGGRNLARLHVYRDGVFTLEPTGSDSPRFVIHRETSGLVSLGARSGRARFVLHFPTDGSANIRFDDADGKLTPGVSIDARSDIEKLQCDDGFPGDR